MGRLVLGSDNPVGSLARVLADAVAHVRGLVLDAAVRRRVAGASAAALFGVPADGPVAHRAPPVAQ